MDQSRERPELSPPPPSDGSDKPTETETINKLIESIKSGRTIVFCGAGVSLHSGIPTVSQLLPYVLDKFDIPHGRILDDKGVPQIPFESIIEALSHGSEMARFLDIFGAEQDDDDILVPNFNHILLAKLVKAKYLKTIITSNFDRLIEKALESEGLKRGRDFLVFHDVRDFPQIDWSETRPRLIKLHGSIEDRKGMAVTFNRVDSQGHFQASLDVMRYVFSTGAHEDVLVLGYSGSDKFDLTPLIRACSFEPKNVLYVEHSTDRRIEPIGNKGAADPFMLFPSGWRLFYNTDDLMRDIWEAFFVDQRCDHKSDESWRRDYVDEWHSALVEPFPELIVAEILRLAAHFDEAAQHFQTALIHAGNTGDRSLQSAILCELGKTRKELGQYSLAKTLLKDSLAIAADLGDKEEQRAIENLLRSLPSDEPYERQVIDLEKAREAARNRQDYWTEASILVDLGNARLVHQEYQEALNSFEQALELVWRRTRARVVILNNMGFAYTKLGQHKLGECYYFIAIEPCVDLGDRQGQGNTLGLLGDSLADQQDFETALKVYEQSLVIAEAIGDDRMKAHALLGRMRANEGLGAQYRSADSSGAARALMNALEKQDLPTTPEILTLNEKAKLSFLLGQYEDGVQLLADAYSKAKGLMDMRGQIITLNNMGIAAVGMNSVPSGIECHEKALTLSRQLDDRGLELATLERLSRLFSHIGEPLNVTRYYEEAIRMARNRRDHEKEIDYLNLLAGVYFNLGEFQRAINPLERALQVSREAEHLRLQGVILNNFGNIHASLEEFDAAVDYFQQALRIFQSLHLNDSVRATQFALDRALNKRRIGLR